jgi:hypothetical protein
MLRPQPRGSNEATRFHCACRFIYRKNIDWFGDFMRCAVMQIGTINLSILSPGEAPRRRMGVTVEVNGGRGVMQRHKGKPTDDAAHG